MLCRLTLALIAALHLGCSDASEAPTVREPSSTSQAGQPTTAGAGAGAPALQQAGSPGASPTPRASLADWLRNARSGSLILRSQGGGNVSAGMDLGSEIEVTITGTIVRATVRQKFTNPSDAWVEGLYVFPLPDDAAVDHLRVLTDGRVIEGQIQEKEEARKTYEAAKAEGKRAGLVEQERPNVFTTSVANIRPDSEVTIEIEYQQSVRLDAGQFSLRVPTVVAPRYLPGQADLEAPLPTELHPFEITLDLAPGFDVATLESPYHPIAVVDDDDGHTYHVTLAEGPVPADRDFVLQWTPAPGQEPEAVVFTETVSGETYALMMVTPPFQERNDAKPLPREVIYVVDTSGSMAGASMVQAQSALAFALERLKPQDRFNVIQFNSVTSALFEKPQYADPATVKKALAYVDDLAADGGTVIAPAIRLALADDRASRASLRQIVFLTDGSVGNEGELLEEIEQSLGESRVFAVGIGNAPNTFFMRKLAELGRGSFTYIGDPNEVAEKMTGLFHKLESAVLADVAIELPEGIDVEMYPYRVPDLYAGEPVVVALKLDAPLDQASVKGWTADSPWQVNLGAWDMAERPGIHVLWARKAIEERMDDRLGTRDEKLLAELRAEIVDLAIDHHLVSAYTSLVAVDVTPERYAHEPLVPNSLGAKLPARWRADSAFGLAQGATPAGLHIWIGLLLCCIGWGWRRIAS